MNGCEAIIRRGVDRVVVSWSHQLLDSARNRGLVLFGFLPPLTQLAIQAAGRILEAEVVCGWDMIMDVPAWRTVEATCGVYDLERIYRVKEDFDPFDGKRPYEAFVCAGCGEERSERDPVQDVAAGRAWCHPCAVKACKAVQHGA